MLRGLKLLAGAYSADFDRLKTRTATAAAFYAFAVVIFAAAIGLATAAGTIALVQTYGTVAGLLIAALCMLLAGALALLVNGIMQRRYHERAERAAVTRSALMSETADEGLRRTRDAVPSMLPATAFLAFALTSMLLNGRR